MLDMSNIVRSNFKTHTQNAMTLVMPKWNVKKEEKENFFIRTRQEKEEEQR